MLCGQCYKKIIKNSCCKDNILYFLEFAYLLRKEELVKEEKIKFKKRKIKLRKENFK